MASGRVSDAERAQILAWLDEGLSRNEVAKRSGRSNDTVSKIARSVGHDFLAAADDRTRAALDRAHEARSAFCAERRATIAARLTDEAEKLLDQLHEPHVAFNFGGKENTYAEVTHPEPPVDAKRALIQSTREAMRTVLDIDRHDNRADEGAAAVDGWLRSIMGQEAAT